MIFKLVFGGALHPHCLLVYLGPFLFFLRLGFPHHASPDKVFRQGAKELESQIEKERLDKLERTQSTTPSPDRD